MIASGKVRSAEVVEAYLDRIKEVNPSVNAVTVTLADTARDAATGRLLSCSERHRIGLKSNCDQRAFAESITRECKSSGVRITAGPAQAQRPTLSRS